jgi:hypothetical protein
MKTHYAVDLLVSVAHKTEKLTVAPLLIETVRRTCEFLATTEICQVMRTGRQPVTQVICGGNISLQEPLLQSLRTSVCTKQDGKIRLESTKRDTGDSRKGHIA